MISIIVPVYKVEKYLGRCIESILSQTYRDFELILVDDGSPDDCAKICEEYAEKDSRIIVIHKENGGLSDARNAGLDIAKGEYIGFVDSDDYIDGKMYEILYSDIKKYHADISMCGYYDLFEKTQEKTTKCNVEQICVWNREQTIKEVLLGRRLGVHAPTKLYKRSIFADIRYPLGKVSEDAYVIMDILDQVNKAVFTELPLYYYCHREGSINTSKINERDFTRFEASEKNCQYVNERYPKLKRLAFDNYLKEKYLVGRKILMSDNGDEYKRELTDICLLIRKNIHNICVSEYFPLKRKVNVICFALCPRVCKRVLLNKYGINV